MSPFVFIAVLVAAPPTPTQALARRITQSAVTVYDRKSGLPSPTISALAQDAAGDLWVGTDLGVARFDGLRFVTYRKATSPALPSDDIASLAAAGDHVWIGTAAGLARFQGDLIEMVPGAPTGLVTRLYEDSHHDLWLSTPDATFRAHDGVFTAVSLPDGTPFGQAVFAEAGDGSVWLAGRSVWRFRDGALRDEVDPRAFAHMVRDVDGSIWASGGDALTHFTPARVDSYPLPGKVYADLARGPDGATWLTSSSGLVRRTADGTFETAKADSGPFASVAHHVLVGRDGEIWVGTQAGGLVRLRDGAVLAWSATEGLPGHAVYGIGQGQDGVIVATEAGLAHVTREVRMDAFHPASPPAAILEEGNRLWLGTDELLIVEGGRSRQVDSAAVFALAVKGAEVWAATSAGLSRYQNGARVATYTDGDNRSFISMALAADGSIWVGHRTGVCRFAEEKLHCFGPEVASAPHGTVASLTQDKQHDMWLGTTENGLYRVRSGGWLGSGEDAARRIAKLAFDHWQDELPSRSHYVVLDDQRGSLWSSSPRGLTRIVRGSLDAGPVEARLYDEADGMRSTDCMSIGMKGLRASDGTLWFATTEGVAVVDPTRLGAGAAAGTRAARVTTTRPGWLTFDYAATTLAFADTLVFRHQLEGFDDAWVNAPVQTASYTNVPPGTYRFLTQARGRSGAWSDATVTSVTVEPRWSQTWWFRAAVAAVVLLMGYGAHRLRIASLMRQKEDLEYQVRARTEDLQLANELLAERNATLEERSR